MTKQRNKQDREQAALIALTRYSQFLIHEGCAIGAYDYAMRLGGANREKEYLQKLSECNDSDEQKAIQEELERAARQKQGSRSAEWPKMIGHFPDSPVTMAFCSGSGSYDQYINGEVTPYQLQSLVLFFKAEISAHPWGRILFFLVMGGYPDKEGVVVSKLPRFLYPSCCILPSCENPIVFKKTPHPRRVCVFCSIKDWDSSDKKAEKSIANILRKALEIAFDYPSIAEWTLQEKFQVIWEGYVELCRYRPGKLYRPFALKWSVYRDSGVTNETLSESLARLLVLPHERHSGEIWQGIPAVQLASYGSNATTLKVGLESIATFSSELKEFDRVARLGGMVYLPVKAFREKAILRRKPLSTDEVSTWLRPVVRDGVDNSNSCHPYRLISCYQDKNGKPIGLNGKVDSDNYILASALDKVQV